MGRAGSLLSVATVHSAIPPVLDLVVAAVAHFARNVRPSLSLNGDKLLDPASFFFADGRLVQVRIEVLRPSLSYLLCRSILHLGGHFGPMAHSVPAHKTPALVVLCCAPGAFGDILRTFCAYPFALLASPPLSRHVETGEWKVLQTPIGWGLSQRWSSLETSRCTRRIVEFSR